MRHCYADDVDSPVLKRPLPLSGARVVVREGNPDVPIKTNLVDY
jgi:hypothetical protein